VKAGAPLDNNVAERALKRIILLRKASLFFKTENGAFIGGMLTSLIVTCIYANVDPIDYLEALQQYEVEVHLTPEKWFPWCYQETIADLKRDKPMAA